MSSPATYYRAPEYHAPNIVRSMGNMLRAPRVHYSTNFTDVFSSDRQEQYHYVNGLLAVMVSFVVILVFWVFVLLVLKFKGQEVGCASGQAFLAKRDGEDVSSTDDDEGSFSSIGSRAASQQNSISKLIKRKESLDNFLSNDTEGENGPPTDPMTRVDDSRSFENESRVPFINPRERRTRFCFIVCSLLSFICVPTILVTSFSPLKEAAQTSNELVAVAREILFQVSSSVDSIEEATRNATEILKGETLDVESICPNVNVGDLEVVIGIDLNQLIITMTDEFNITTKKSEESLEYVRSLIQNMDDGLVAYDASVVEAEGWLWTIPATLFSVTTLTVVSTLGVIYAWRGKSGQKMQNVMSYVVLPLLMATTVACWIMVLMSSFGTMVGSDVCTSSTSTGSPDETIQQILGILNLNPNTTGFKAVQAYTNRCLGPDPTEEIELLKKIIQENIDIIWRQISRIDSLGREEIMERCGGYALEDLLLIARDLAKILTSIRRSLDGMSTSLSCARINPLYILAAHDTVCTTTAAATASGFLLFLLLAVSLMTMICLRASWLQHIKEEKVYHDESEVAENMILDEHEEYLAYISKYKHEWQEYCGFEEKPINPQMGVGGDEESYSDRSEGSSYSDADYRIDGAAAYDRSMVESDEESEDGSVDYQLKMVPIDSIKDSYQSIDEVSLPNLQIQGSTTTCSVLEDDLIRVPSAMLPPPANPEFQPDDRSKYARAPVLSVLERHISKSSASSDDAMQSSGGFFEKYGINPGSSVRRKNLVASSQTTSPKRDPPGVRPQPRVAPLGEGLIRRDFVQSQQDTTRTNLRTRGRLPSGRIFFKADSDVDDAVEIHLVNASHSQRYVADDSTFEC